MQFCHYIGCVPVIRWWSQTRRGIRGFLQSNSTTEKVPNPESPFGGQEPQERQDPRAQGSIGGAKHLVPPAGPRTRNGDTCSLQDHPRRPVTGSGKSENNKPREKNHLWRVLSEGSFYTSLCSLSDLPRRVSIRSEPDRNRKKGPFNCDASTLESPPWDSTLESLRKQNCSGELLNILKNILNMMVFTLSWWFLFYYMLGFIPCQLPWT